MIELGINYQKLEEYLNKFEKQMDALDSLEHQCSDAVKSLSESWTGTACSAYVQTMQNYTAQMKNLYALLQAMDKGLVSVMKMLEAADSEYGDMISGL